MRAALATAPLTSAFPPSQDGVPQCQTSLTNQTNPNKVNVHQPASTAHSLQRKLKPGRSMSTHCSHTLQSLSRSPWRYTTDLTAHEEQRSAGAHKQLSPCCCIHWYCKAQKKQEASLLSSHSLTLGTGTVSWSQSQSAWLAHGSREKSLQKLDGNPWSPGQGLADSVFTTKLPLQALQR